MFSDIVFDYLKGYKFESSDDFNHIVESSEGKRIRKDRYEISTREESEKYDKPIGKYELISIPDVLVFDKKDIEKCVDEVTESIKGMIGEISLQDRILIVGLGNRHISSDSLGTKVVSGINITIENKHLPKVMAIAPSVMGLTGIETVEIVEGVVA